MFKRSPYGLFKMDNVKTVSLLKMYNVQGPPYFVIFVWRWNFDWMAKINDHSFQQLLLLAFVQRFGEYPTNLSLSTANLTPPQLQKWRQPQKWRRPYKEDDLKNAENLKSEAQKWRRAKKWRGPKKWRQTQND